MNPEKTTKEVIYKMHKIKSCFNNAVKVHPKRKSDDIIKKNNLLFILKNEGSNIETVGDSHNTKSMSKKISPKANSSIPKQKRICIKYEDLVADSDKNDDENNNNLELALILKKKRKHKNRTNVKRKKLNDVDLNNNKNKEEYQQTLSNCKSMGKIILGEKTESNTFFKKIKRKLFCC